MVKALISWKQCGVSASFRACVENEGGVRGER